jgi:hypothetical protein
MGVTLRPTEGEAIRCNWWNWRPTVAFLLRRQLPYGEAREVAEATNGDILTLSADEALQAAHLVDEALARMARGERLLLDGSTTFEPDSGEFFRDPKQQVRNYSATKDWLVTFRDFCRRSKGFTAS